jgi:hypothetical protein
VLAMDVIIRLNVMDDPAEIVFGEGVLRRRRQQCNDQAAGE